MREFCIVVRAVPETPGLCEMRCPECGSQDLLMLPVHVANGMIRSVTSIHGVATESAINSAPIVRIPFCCAQGHHFDYAFGYSRGRDRVFITHSIFEPTEAEGSTM